MQIILGSSSPYRKALLTRLGFPFTVHSPDVDETPLMGEGPRALAERLALEKARAVAQEVGEGAIVIGSDQVCEARGETLGKPLTRSKAIEQLSRLSGQSVVFHTAAVVICPNSEESIYVPTELVMRKLALEEIERYVDTDQPLQCAGALKTEALGIALVERITSSDPTAIVGLPLIEVSRCLRACGLHLP